MKEISQRNSLGLHCKKWMCSLLDYYPVIIKQKVFVNSQTFVIFYLSIYLFYCGHTKLYSCEKETGAFLWFIVYLLLYYFGVVWMAVDEICINVSNWWKYSLGAKYMPSFKFSKDVQQTWLESLLGWFWLPGLMFGTLF